MKKKDVKLVDIKLVKEKPTNPSFNYYSEDLLEKVNITSTEFKPIIYSKVTKNTKFGYEYGEIYDEVTGESYPTNKYKYFQFYYKNQPVNYLTKEIGQINKDKKIDRKFMLNERLSILFQSNIDKIKIEPVYNYNVYQQALETGDKEEIENQKHFGRIEYSNYIKNMADMFMELKQESIQLCLYEDPSYDGYGSGAYQDIDYEDIFYKISQIINKITKEALTDDKN